jgi:hypothetical protein
MPFIFKEEINISAIFINSKTKPQCNGFNLLP